MDERARETFKIRFIELTLLLNAIVLLIAIGAFVLIRYHSTLGIGVGLGLLAVAVVIYLFFSRIYQSTRDWLTANAGPGDEKH